jgi:sulfide dehydrogenase [flavocytochrome c] flavoprotein chain
MERRIFLLSSLAAATGALTACGGGGGADAAGTVSAADGLSPSALIGSGTIKSRVIVIGGGLAGATVAKYLRLWGDGVAVTMIERNKTYNSPIMSSLLITGQRSVSSLSFGYDALVNKYGVNVVYGDVVSIDPVRTSVTLASGQTLTADRIVMAPGIEFDPVSGLADANLMPHAWKGGAQVALLGKQLAAMPSNGVVAITIPKAPYRAAAAPYARACLIADWLKKSKPSAKLLVLDANADITSEKLNFSAAFTGIHASVLEYRPNVQLNAVDTSQMLLYTDSGIVKANVVNLIPSQRAGSVVAAAGLATANGGRFAPVNVLSYASTIAPNIHIIGDSCSTPQPKAGSMANQEAKVCADALVRIFAGASPDAAPVTSGAGYSAITMSQASWATSKYQYNPTLGTMAAATGSPGLSNGWNQDNFDQMGKWFQALLADTFA